MLYFIVVTMAFMFAMRTSYKLETHLLKNEKFSRGFVSLCVTMIPLAIIGVSFFTPIIFDYQAYTDMPKLYVEHPDGTISQPLIGVFHKPFTSETERRSFRFNPGPRADSGREVTLVMVDDGVARTLTFRMTWQYALDPGEYRRLQKTGEIDRVLDRFDSRLTLQAFQLMERKPEVVRSLLFPVNGSQDARLEKTVCEAIPRLMREHLVTPASWIEVGEPFNCWLSTLK